MEKAKVVILGKIPPPFMGTTVWFETLQNSSLNDFYDITWFNVNVHKDFSTLGKASYLKIWSNFILYLKFFRVLRETRPEIVLVPISQTSSGFLKDSVFIHLAEKYSKTLVILHGSNLKEWLSNAPKWIQKYFKLLIHRSSGAIVLGEKLRYLFEDWLPNEKIFVVPNGKNLDFSNVEKSYFDKVILCFLANLSEAKGIIETVNALESLSDLTTKFELRINGAWRNDVLKRKIENQIREKSLPVHYEGIVTGKDKCQTLIDSDIFIFPPNKAEGHPLVITEAMAAGLPIISTDQGAITESVIDGDNGFIVPPKDPEAIAEKLRLLIENKALRAKMGRRSIVLYEQNFTEEKMVQRLRLVFDKTLGIDQNSPIID